MRLAAGRECGRRISCAVLEVRKYIEVVTGLRCSPEHVTGEVVDWSWFEEEERDQPRKRPQLLDFFPLRGSPSSITMSASLAAYGQRTDAPCPSGDAGLVTP